MANQPDPNPEPFKIEAIPHAEETLTPEEAEATEGGGLLNLSRVTIAEQVTAECAVAPVTKGGGCQVIRNRNPGY